MIGYAAGVDADRERRARVGVGEGRWRIRRGSVGQRGTERGAAIIRKQNRGSIYAVGCQRRFSGGVIESDGAYVLIRISGVDHIDTGDDIRALRLGYPD